MNQPIEINIEQIILHGFSSTDRHRIGEAVRSELARLFMEKGMPQNFNDGGNLTSLDGGTFHMSKTMHARSIGSRIAQSIYGGMGQ